MSSRKGKSNKSGSQRRPSRLRDIAELAEVDVSVVSRTLNEDPKLAITPETRQRILNAAAELNYRPNAMARGLRQARTKIIGLLVPNVANFVYFELIHGIEERAFEEGYVLLLANAQEHDKTSEAYKRLVLERRVDGLLIASAADAGVVPMDFDANADPIVWVNRSTEHGPNVIEDDEKGIALAVEHLTALGHRHIGHIAGPQDVDTGRRRQKGFIDAMRNVGLDILDMHIVSAAFSEAGGAESMENLLAASTPPSGIVTSSLSAAIGALAVIKRYGMRVPDDISLLAFHDAPIADYLDPPLTTIRMPLRELGHQAVVTLLKLMNGEQVPANTLIATPPEFVNRNSTAPPSNT